jgi:hypothetical protein
MPRLHHRRLGNRRHHYRSSSQVGAELKFLRTNWTQIGDGYRRCDGVEVLRRNIDHQWRIRRLELWVRNDEGMICHWPFPEDAMEFADQNYPIKNESRTLMADKPTLQIGKDLKPTQINFWLEQLAPPPADIFITDQSQWISCVDCGSVIHVRLGTLPWHMCNNHPRNILMRNKGQDFRR